MSFTAAVLSHRTRVACAVAAFVLSAPAFAAYDYTLSDYPGAPVTVFLGLNNRGEVGGNAQGFTNGAVIPFYYDARMGQYTPIAALTDFDVTEVWNINDWGTTVGIAHSLDYSVETAFIRDSNGNYTLLPHPGLPYSEAQGLNNAGVVVGEAWNADYSQAIGFIYDPADRSFIDMMPSSDTEVHGINSRGEVVGEVTLAAGTAYANSPAGNYGFYRATNGAITLFRVDGMDTYARAINDAGVIAGEVFDSGGNATGFVFTLGDAANHRRGTTRYESLKVPLLLVPGQTQTAIQAVTEEGNLAGVTVDASGAVHGFVARRQYQLR
jgi:hypothetical protein